MKNLVVYYSRTGNTKKVAEEISKIIKADIDEVSENKNRKGIIGWLGAGKDAMSKKETKISFKINPDKYDLILIGTPIWGFTVVPAIRTYLLHNKDKLKKVAFFSTSGGSPIDKVAIEMEKISKKPIATLGLTTSSKIDLSKDNNLEKIKAFCEKIKSNK